MDGDDVVRAVGLQGLQSFGQQGPLLVFCVVAGHFGGEHSVDVDFCILVVEEPEAQFLQLAVIDVADLERTPEPDVAAGPCRASATAEAGLSAPPGRCVEVCRVPVGRGLGGRVLPLDAGLLVASSHDGGCVLVAAVDGAQNLGLHAGLLLGGDLQHLAVVGQEAVAFLFHVGYLRVDRHPEPLLLLQFLQAVGVAVVEIRVGAGVVHRRVVDVGARPHVILDEEVDAAELAARSHALVYGVRGCTRAGVGVDVEEVAHLDIYPSRHGMHEAPGVVIGFHDAVDGLPRMRHAVLGVLPPAFVPHNPCANAGMVARGIDEGLVLAVEVLLAVLERADCTASAARRHVLPDDEAVAVAPLKPKVVLQLDVLAHHVHAEVLYRLQVEDHRFVRRGREQSVGPPTLVQGTVEIERLVVEQDAGMSVGHSARELPHAEVAADLVGFLRAVAQGDVEGVEVRLVGAP